MARIEVNSLSLYFPVIGADSRSLKRHLKQVAIGGGLAKRSASSSQPIVVALRDVNLALTSGDRLGLVGANGSGKTTLLRCLAGAYSPDQGAVEVTGRITSLLDLGMGLDTSATGIENIMLRGMIAGLTRDEVSSRLESIAEFSGLGPFLAMPMKTYSSGMQARLAFAAATSVEADILLMDEWIAVGDAGFRQQAHDRLTSLVEQSRILVLATHDPNLIRTLCNKVMRMDHGMASEVVPVEQMDELLARPVPGATLEATTNY
jgi:lipopolysaccharide transport system ATP-binding protein